MLYRNDDVGEDKMEYEPPAIRRISRYDNELEYWPIWERFVLYGSTEQHVRDRHDRLPIIDIRTGRIRCL